MFNNNGYSLSDIAAATGNVNNGGFGFGGDGAWLLVLFILLLAGGNWNNGTNGGGATYITNDVQRGFDQSAVINGITGINQTLNNNQMNLAAQLSAMSMAQQECCCENRAATADLKYTIATEACADRAAVTEALRDVIASNTANTQAILDKLCQQEIDALKAQNQQLQMQGYLASLAASQNAQTGQILTDNAAQTATLLRTLNPTPVPAYVVANPYGCGCGNGCNVNGFYN